MLSVAEFLIERLENAGIKHVFGVPGDYILNYFGQLASKSKKIEVVNCVDEAGAGFAADAYARIKGLGCVIATYNVGALKLTNSIAGASAERSSVIVISGSPGMTERGDAPLHHSVGTYDYQKTCFKDITCAQTVLDNPATAGYEIDRVLECLKYKKQPVYIELPRDIVSKFVDYDVYTQGTPKTKPTDQHNLEDAIEEVLTWINNAKSPVILAGVEIARFQLGKELIKFAERHNIPVACTLLSKSVVNETHPLYIGVYAGSNSSKEHVRDMVESSDCLLVCGEVITEATVGYRPSKAFNKRDMVTCTVDQLKVKNHAYSNVHFIDFCKNLFGQDIKKRETPTLPSKEKLPKFIANDVKLTTVRLFEKIDSIISEDTLIIADVGDSLLGASDLTHTQSVDTFLGQAFYLSMGFAIPAALGAGLANKKLRPIVIVGDGAFQMSFTELSTIARWKLNPIIFVLNNKGYTTERFILDGKFNDVLNWNYHKVNELLGIGDGMIVKNEKELDVAVEKAFKSGNFYVINCEVDSLDISPALKRMAEAISKKVKTN